MPHTYPKIYNHQYGQMAVNLDSVGLPVHLDNIPKPHWMETFSLSASFAILERPLDDWQGPTTCGSH
ncbi:hypothetical protein GL2_30890 [Microbulbifer sp. GL-2]|nr:hypothetical protein GL2_30890 [Microbulbifer sp. GL-2]